MSVALTISQYPEQDEISDDRDIVNLLKSQTPCFGWFTLDSKECVSCGLKNSCRTEQHTRFMDILPRYLRRGVPRPQPVVVPETFLMRLRQRPFAQSLAGVMQCPHCREDLVDGELCYNVLTTSQGRPASLAAGTYHPTCLTSDVVPATV